MAEIIPETKRTHRIDFRLTAKEEAMLDNQVSFSNSPNRSAYLRRLVFEDNISLQYKIDKILKILEGDRECLQKEVGKKVGNLQ